MAWQTTQPSLIARVRDPSDAAAWAEFDRRYGELIVRFCVSRGLQLNDAEDVRQVVLLNLSKALPRFEYAPAKGRFRNYLGRAVRNEIFRLAKCPSRAGRALDSHVLDTVAEERTHDDRWEDEWLHHHLRLGLHRLRQTARPRSVEVFDLLLDGRAVGEIAAALDMTPDAVAKIRQRMRARLRSIIAEQLRDEDEPHDPLP